MVKFWLLGALLLIFLLPFFAPFDPTQVHLESLKLLPSKTHWLGTDFLGRDEFSRFLFALRNSVFVGLVGGLLALLISLGFAFGVLFAPKWGRAGLLGFLDGFLALPTLLLILLFSALSVRGFGILALGGLLSLFLWAQMAKVLSDGFREIATREFIANERALGASKFEIAFCEILPLAKNSVFVLLANTCAHAISAEALLSFFGLGLKVGEASLGNMLNEASQAIFTGVWWLVLVPGVAVFVVVFVLAYLGERLGQRA
ncbi:ABC transporter permease [Helicobacter ailurogastricus]|uniref:Putative peptide ABC-transport system permease protein n=1 Tax=Helicobacter ailurogastricus TaxID=1578720 RepID=A0A0K2Y5R7_9HELI|nr:ABC transporter permease subunit [Helicobacter ailurogastricus]CRF52485.1 Putative peptide ABC-transport system permease protein [Helicobacter ailurogastricus]